MKRPRNLPAPQSSSNVIALPVYRGIRPKPATTQTSANVFSTSNITSSASSTSSSLSVAFNNRVREQSSGFSSAESPGLLPWTLPASTPLTSSMTLNTSSLQENSVLSEAHGSRIFQDLSSTEATQPMQPGILSSVQNDSSQNMTMSPVPAPNNNGFSIDVILQNLIALQQQQLQQHPQQQQLLQQLRRHQQIQQQLLHQNQSERQQHQVMQQQQNLQHQQQQQQQQLCQQSIQHLPPQQPHFLPLLSNVAPNTLGLTNSLAPTVVDSQQNIFSPASLDATFTTQSLPRTNQTNIGGQRNAPVGISVPVQPSVILPQSHQQPQSGPGTSCSFHHETPRDTMSPFLLFPNGLSETATTSAASPLNALADAIVEGGRMDQDLELMNDASDTDDSSEEFQVSSILISIIVTHEIYRYNDKKNLQYHYREKHVVKSYLLSTFTGKLYHLKFR